MLIRSQDKKSLYNLTTNKGLWIRHKNKGVAVIAEGLGELGNYANENKAIKVLDMIQEHYSKHYFGQGGQMATSSAVFQPFGFIPPKIFHMPTDEEVEV
jgi:hypothetical protein